MDKPDETSTGDNLKFERFKFKMSLLKWFVGSVALVAVTIIIDNGFKERTAGIQEMQAFDKYVDIILKADNIEERWKLSEFFSTVTPTERLRTKWLTYKQIISPDYEKFKKLKQAELELSEKVQYGKSVENITKLNKIKKQLEPFEKKLIDQNNFVNDKQNVSDFTSNDKVEPEINKFKEKTKKEASSDNRYKLDKYFKKINEINNSVVNDLVKELGDPIQNIQTGINYDYQELSFYNQYGIVSKFDNRKRIWPLLQAKFTDSLVIITLTEDGKTETYSSPISNIEWDKIKQFIRTYFVKRLDKLK